MGSLHYLNGEVEQMKTETTVYYTRESTGERSSTVFTCPRCGKHRLAERITGATVLIPVNAVVVEEDEPGDASEAKTSEYNHDGIRLIDYSRRDTAYECADCHVAVEHG